MTPVNRIDDRTLPLGPMFAKARALYWDFAAVSPYYEASASTATSSQPVGRQAAPTA